MPPDPRRIAKAPNTAGIDDDLNADTAPDAVPDPRVVWAIDK
jgi:hypothetical protein